MNNLIFRELPELAKHYIMRILFVDTPIAVPAVSSWVTKDAKKLVKNRHMHYFSLCLCFQLFVANHSLCILTWCNSSLNCSDHKEAINILCELRIWVQLSLKGGLPAYSLSDTFRSSLKKALLGG